MSEKRTEQRLLSPHAGRGQWYRSVAAVLVVGAILSVATFFFMRLEERNQARWEFEKTSRDHVAALWKTLELDFLVMRSVQSLFAGSDKVTADEFRVFVTPLINDHRSIRAAKWAPRVQSSDGKAEFPIEWIEPYSNSATSLGFNLDADPACRQAMQRACATGQMIMTSKVTLPSELGVESGVRVFLPVYANKATAASGASRCDDMWGFIVVVIRLKGIAEESLAALTPVGIDVKLTDDSAVEAADRTLYAFNSRTRMLDTSNADTAGKASDETDLSYVVSKEVAGRHWVVSCTASPRFFADRATFYPWVSAAGVLLVAALLAFYLMRRGQMAAVLAESEHKLRGVLDQSYQFMGIISPNGRLLDINKAALDFIGARKSSVLNKLCWETPWWTESKEMHDKFREVVQKAAEGLTVKFEAHHLAVDGTVRWVDSSVKPVKDDDGTVLYLVAEGRDITPIKLAVQRQEQSILRLEQMNRLQEELLSPGTLENKLKKTTDAAVGMLDLDFCRVWIIRPGDLCDSGCPNLAGGQKVCEHPDKCLHLVSSSGRYEHTDGRYQRIPFGHYKIGRIASGAEKSRYTNHVATDPQIEDHEWAKELGLVSFAGYKLHDMNGKTTGVLAMFAKHPLTEEDAAFLENLAEITSKTIHDCRAAESLRISERRHRLFAENVSDVIWTTDFTGRITYVSPSVQRILGFTPEEYQEFSLPQIMTPASFATVLPRFEEYAAAAGTDRQLEPDNVEIEACSKDGSTIWCEVAYSGMYDESGKMIAVQGITHDISARKRLENELREAKKTAESATQAKSRFLASMSHEIRNPMTSILGYTDLMLDPASNQSSRNNYLAVIRRNGEHLLGLINDILDLSKIEAGKFTVDLQRCCLVSLLADVASIVRPRAEQRGLSLTIEYKTELPETILTDAARLRQALVNLAGNAVKFTEEGGVRIIVWLLPIWQGHPAVRVQVIDTGIGIREEEMAKLFEPFMQGDESVYQRFGGTGLGLAISRHIVNMLGGELAVTSVWGQGSTFSLTVPIGDIVGVSMLQNPTEIERDIAVQLGSTPARELEGLHILLAEDGYDNRELIKTVLRSAGAEVETAVNGQEAVERVAASPFDTVLMDMNMPVMDGYEATRKLRDNGYKQPILALTANAMVTDTKRCLDAGCDRHLTKPIDRRRLVHTIAVCMGRSTWNEEQEEMAILPTPAEVGEGPVVSLFAEDPDVAGILGGFIDGLDEQLSEMGRVLSEDRFDDLKRLAHRLKGAGGSYGYPALTDLCKILEDAATAKDRETAEKMLEKVAGMCRAVKDGYQTTANS